VQLGAKLRELRDAAGITGGQLAGRVGMSQSKISKLETGRLLPSVEDVERLANALRAPDDVKAALLDQATTLHSELHAWRALHRPSFRRRQEEIREAEATATEIRLFQPAVVPGLLQTAEYARHVLTVGRFTGIEDVVDSVASRVARQAVLYNESKRFWFVITEGALRWRLCPSRVLLAQLNHIASLSTLTNVQVGVIPWSAHVPARQTNQFCIFDERMVLVETLTAELTLKEEQDIAYYRSMFSLLEEHAQFGDDANAALQRIASDVRGLTD